MVEQLKSIGVQGTCRGCSMMLQDVVEVLRFKEVEV